MKKIIIGIFFLLVATSVFAQNANINGIVNKYSPVTSFTCDKVVVENGTLFSAGDRVLIIQMKGARVDTSNTANFGAILDYRSAGNYEFNTVKSVSGNTITLQFALKKSYETTGNVQLVYVPVYTDVTVGGKITGTPWDGKKGGVIAMEVSGTLTLNADIDASGIGFRGGKVRVDPMPLQFCAPNVIFGAFSKNEGGQKGEGIAVWDSLKLTHKGAWANGGGGGNDANAGGGGGANGGNGGRGGKLYYEPNNQPNCQGGHGIGGKPLNSSFSISKLFLGGGGGAGHDNDNVGSSGANGGGLIIIKATTINGNNFQIISKGLNALNAGNDGAGGGGGGGTIAISATSINNCKLISDGGNGGNNTWTTFNQCHGTGGGGGGGTILHNANLNLTTLSFIQGIAGRLAFTNPPAPCTNINFEAEAGISGKSLNNLQLSYSDKIQASTLDSTEVEVSLCNNQNYTLPDGTVTNQAGVYRNILQNIAGCDSIIIKTDLSYTLEPNFTLGNDTILCLGTEIILNPGVNGSYSWQDGSSSPTFNASVPGTYSLNVSNECGSVSDTISFEGIDCNCTVFIPNAFSPNNDGKNDNLIIKEVGITSSTLIIYSKWGEEVFSSTNNNRQWDGTVDGKNPQPDVYGYYYRGVCLTGTTIIKKGDITIVK
jgi:gliding motility-associated-like protein